MNIKITRHAIDRTIERLPQFVGIQIHEIEKILISRLSVAVRAYSAGKDRTLIDGDMVLVVSWRNHREQLVTVFTVEMMAERNSRRGSAMSPQARKIAELLRKP